MKRIIVFAILIVTAWSLQAQERFHYDVIYLKNGSEFRGELLDYQPDFVKLRALGGKVITFQQKEIKKIVQEPINGKRRTPKPYQFKEKGVYKALFGNINAGTFAWRDESTFGLGFKGLVGYQWNRWLGTGIGLGVENYYLNQGETVYPLFAEVRGYLVPENIAPYYSISGGYSFTIKNEEAGIIDANGGWMIHPAFGIRWGGSSKVNFTVDAGVQLQKATFVRGINPWGGPDIQENRMTYHRLAIRFGMLF